MAKNGQTGDGHRNGMVRDRTQLKNPKNKKWTKRGEAGEFIDQKADGTRFKGVRREDTDVE